MDRVVSSKAAAVAELGAFVPVVVVELGVATLMEQAEVGKAALVLEQTRSHRWRR